MPNERVHWVAQLTINDGALGEFKRRGQETIDSVKENEPGNLVYQWSISSDGRLCHIDEWFAGPEAAMAHIAGDAVTEKLPALLAVSQLTGLWVYTPIQDSELRDALASLGAVFFDYWSGPRD